MVENLKRGVGWEVNTVEACVGPVEEEKRRAVRQLLLQFYYHVCVSIQAATFNVRDCVQS